MGRRLRTLVGLWMLAEIVVFVLVASWIGLGWTILATLATSAVGLSLLGRQGTRALGELRERARSGQAPGRALGDAGLVAVGGALMLLPGFLGDLVGLLCLLPVTRFLPRAIAARLFGSRIPDRLRGPVQVRSARVAGVGGHDEGSTVLMQDMDLRWAGEQPPVIEGEVIGGEVVDGVDPRGRPDAGAPGSAR